MSTRFCCCKDSIRLWSWKDRKLLLYQNCQVIRNLKNQNSNPKKLWCRKVYQTRKTSKINQKAQNSIQIPDNFIFAENIFWQFFKSRAIENMTTWTSNRNFMSRKMWKFKGFKVKSYTVMFNFRKNDNLRGFRNASIWGISWLVKTVIDKCQSMSATFIQCFSCFGFGKVSGAAATHISAFII